MTICNNCIEYKKQIDTLEARITCVEYDNDELKKENQEIKKENQMIKKENIILKERIVVLEKENIVLKGKIDLITFNKTKYKIITAIQDINSLYNLELITNINKSLYKLRLIRNNFNHYIDNNSNKYNNDCKQLYLYNKLINLSDEEKYLINKIFNNDENFIGEIINFLDGVIDKNIVIEDDIHFFINMWWED